MKNSRLIILLSIVMITFIAHAQTKELDLAKANIEELLKDKFKFYDKDGVHPVSVLGSPKNILVLDDRIEFAFKKSTRTFYYTDDFKHALGSNNVILAKTECVSFKNNSGDAGKLAENLTFIQHKLNETLYNSELVLFEPVADKYRALEVKPTISEEQRKYIVQANGFIEQRNYDKAIELYLKATEVDPTAYPAAYSNLALLSAQLEKFNAAIYYMKKYLMLEPDADDARSAKDKIYLWEARLGD